MDADSQYCNNYELIGRVLDGGACLQDRMAVAAQLNDERFEECFLVALHAVTLIDEKGDVYETVE
jgi:hypothetical protein